MERLMADLRHLEAEIRADAPSSSARDDSPSPARASTRISGRRLATTASDDDVSRAPAPRATPYTGAWSPGETCGNLRDARRALERACAEVSAREAVELARARALGAMTASGALGGKASTGGADEAAQGVDAKGMDEHRARVSRRARGDAVTTTRRL
jgi:hypothetical protein